MAIPYERSKELGRIACRKGVQYLDGRYAAPADGPDNWPSKATLEAWQQGWDEEYSKGNFATEL